MAVISCGQSMRRSTALKRRTQAHWRTRVAPSRHAASRVSLRTMKTQASCPGAVTVKNSMQQE
ncbi:hypothetical protein D3C72_2330840 [compost metagenome]